MTDKITKKRWAVECDGERWRFATRAQARSFAERLNSHPANGNIRLFGPYLNVDGCARVVDMSKREAERYL